MKLLLDTHVWLWIALEPSRLPGTVRQVLLDAAHEPFVSVASVWEVAIKADLGKLKLPTALPEFIATQTGPGVAELIDITTEHVLALSALPRHHRDPFDRMLVAQTKCEGMTLVTADDALRAYGIPLIWGS